MHVAGAIVVLGTSLISKNGAFCSSFANNFKCLTKITLDLLRQRSEEALKTERFSLNIGLAMRSQNKSKKTIVSVVLYNRMYL